MAGHGLLTSMIVLGITFVFAAVSAWLSLRANARFRHHERLPMQWSLAGTVNWTAPRVLALCLVPALGIGVLAVITVLTFLDVRPRPGQESMLLPVTMLMAATFLAIQILHYGLVDRTLNRNRR